ncbi:radical SAM protein [Sphingosinicella microcystinivorans]|uniref:radical SAM protein n=1 Tax=Sphingosinicella microcystinivorans TaxID=335406 RepID=UPI0022F38005|nr:radical SAM protein [Sphingosinicella microcystinivorans]WBX85967.1 radical SAM protein [Sphingosinicella microcystinivorans]
MWRYYPELLSSAVPRYTSYPTAAEFRPVEAAFHAQGLAAVEAETSLSLYLHIPYCDAICWYCGCNTGAAGHRRRLGAYMQALDREVATVARMLQGRGRVRRVAFGGGSPNAVPPIAFVRLLERLTLAFRALDAEMAIELDPRSYTPEWERIVAMAPLRRVSLGVQTFAPHVQAAIGRVQPLDDIRRTVESLRRAGVRSLNFDLMYGLPGQTDADLAGTLEEAMRLRPERIALFGYAHLPSRIPRQRRIDGTHLPGAEARFRMAERGHEMLVAAGYEAIGFDHFALPEDSIARAAANGRLRRNFQGFTDDDSAVLIGLGATAISSFPDRFVQNEKNVGRYRGLAGDGKLTGALGVCRTADDRRRGAVIEAILCGGWAPFEGEPPDADTRQRLQPFVERGLCTVGDRAISLAEGALPYARAIAACFDAHRHPDAQRFSSAI